MAVFTFPDSGKTDLIEAVLQAGHRKGGLRFESGGAFNHVLGFIHMLRQEQDFQLGGKLIFPALTGNLHGKGEGFFVENTIHNSSSDFPLVWAQSGHTAIFTGVIG
jgi:hypothetical protein